LNFLDQTGKEINVHSTERVISLVPSQTEFLVDVGLGDRLIACTKFCIHPDGLIRDIGHIGGTKNLNIDKIKALKPDFIIGNKEENTKEEIEELRKYFPVWMSDIYSFQDALDMMSDLGEILKLESTTERLISSIDQVRKEYNQDLKSKTCLYFIWKNPNMVVGSENFIDSMIKETGLINLGEKLGPRYPVLDTENEIIQPDFVFLSTEPYPFKIEHIDDFKKQFPHSEIVLVDGEMFSWYGSRLRMSFPYFEKLKQSLFV
jgi:ABC-type Fe3+-hydroxamate transport system substrate-binding protein